jgi:hypothetical protein
MILNFYGMGKSIFLRILLLIGGASLIFIGGSLLFSPVSFQASAGIMLGDDVNLLSEVRASGGALFASGILIAMGAFLSEITFISIIIASLIYLSYGTSRALGMMIDGVPTNSLVVATVAEILLGVTSLLVLIRYRRSTSK